MMDKKRLEQAALEAGIASSYINAHGKPESIGMDTRQQLLAAMGDAPALAYQHSQRVVPPVHVLVSGKRLSVPVKGGRSFPVVADNRNWRITPWHNPGRQAHAFAC